MIVILQCHQQFLYVTGTGQIFHYNHCTKHQMYHLGNLQMKETAGNNHLEGIMYAKCLLNNFSLIRVTLFESLI